MAHQPDIQYVRFYTAGSAARKMELPAEPVKPAGAVRLPRPRVRRQSRRVVRVDPVALCAVAVAGILFIAMAVGVLELASVTRASEKMESYAAGLQSENAQLREAYAAGYDLADIEEKALAMGMVPVSQVEHITVQVPVTQPEPVLTFWQQLRQSIAELFA